ncbi:M36 family metallopeptidase [Solirubrobacter phytolaccae]|uniref:M36 family metallopeptidase n=1 Tax=Solirubrobacter phytolaccae TaxID=1404360 RepID=A0A9X3SBV5_9ACTN|nr:M36 family metallopeptidase [Solirubrobacter phytolaccae]MDA0183951.1 M36 family metallopeptidase [Solirubrobacter phytolaccae]
MLAALALPASARADVELDPATDTVRVAANLDGTLTAPAPGTAAAIGLRYVREHRAALGLNAADLETLGDPTVETFAGIRQVRWPQAVDGIEAADAELRVNVTDDGRVLSVLGSPSSDLPTDTTPRLAKPDPDAELTIYDDRLAYRYEDEVAPDAIYDVITDADTGRVLRKTNLVKSVDAEVWDLHPSDTVDPHLFDIGPWLSTPTSTRLFSQWMHVYSDVNDNNAADSTEEVVPGTYPATLITTGGACTPAKPCTWTAINPQLNREQNAVQAFYLANRFREHLRDAVGFDFGTDRLLLETNDGGGTNNANMYTPPAGRSPRMQMYRWSSTRFRTMNSGDDASILFHEYAHGLTNRLVKYPDGVGALSSWQAGAMGEGWSDFYAKDFIVSSGLENDSTTPGEIHMGEYTDALPNSIRSSALDCPAGSGGSCPGYTYGDFAHVTSGPEVHYDGEIWAQTLWDVRTEIGSSDALRLITAALKLSPPEPSFLDMRNAILLAAAADPAALRAKLWAVFAKRGMGFYASATDGADIAPVEDDSLPPVAGTPLGTLTGTVVDAAGNPVVDATVSIGGVLTAKTNSAGQYTLANTPVRTYEHVIVTAAGYDRTVLEDVAVPGVADATIRRNWAIGATLRSTAGSENAEMGCGPKQAFDGVPGSTWSTSQPGGDKELVLQLPEPINVTGFGVDPGAGCGDTESSSTAQFQIAVGPSATGPWTDVAVTGTLTAADRHVMKVFPTTRSNVTFVRMLPMSTQTANVDYIDLSEFAVYGTQVGARLVTTPAANAASRTATFTFAGGTGYQCQWDAGAFEPCVSPATRTMSEGAHTFTLRASDDPTDISYAWTVDTVAPTVAISGASVSDDVATFTFAATDATALTYRCTFDGSTAPCASPAWYAGLGDGTHNFQVTATDAAANAASASRSVTVDVTAPETTISWAPPPILTTRDFTFAFGASEPSTFVCSVDGVPAQPCTSPLALTGLAEGAHSLEVTAVDASGRADPTPARSDFTVVIPGLPPAPNPTPTATATPRPPLPPLALASATAAKTVSKKTGRVKVTLRGTRGATVTVRAKLGSRVVGKTTKTLRGTSLAFQLALDKKRLTVGKTVTVTLTGKGSGMATGTRTLKIRVNR